LEGEARLKAYLRARLALYHGSIDLSFSDPTVSYSNKQRAEILALKTEMWNRASRPVVYLAAEKQRAALLLRSLNNAFDVARARCGVNERHPPWSSLQCCLAWISPALFWRALEWPRPKPEACVHILPCALALATALHVITEIEFPRLGLICDDAFDHFLAEFQAHMQ
jgi:hypothetical protein